LSTAGEQGRGRSGVKARRNDDELVPGDDGLPARVVGPWVDRKAYYVDRYARMFATGMKNRWPRRAYVELFAGPGQSWESEGDRFVAGSPIRSLERDFTDRTFVEMNPIAAAALTERLRAAGRAATVLIGDCNGEIGRVVDSIPAGALTLAFVDPTNWQVRFETIVTLVTTRKVDLLVTFMYGSMKRVAKGNPPALTAFFGTPDWKAQLGQPRWAVLDGLASLYNSQLEPYGYLPSYTRRIIVPNTKNVPMYALILFSRSPARSRVLGEGDRRSDGDGGQGRLPGF
jgi:three-Cys-motif partner protein